MPLNPLLAVVSLAIQATASIAPLAPAADTALSYAQTPTGDDLVTYYPKQAEALNLDGRALLECVVDKSGALKSCVVQSEEPAGWGFGDAALRLAPLFKMRPATRDGVAVSDARVNIPIHFMRPRVAPEPGAPVAPPYVLAALPPGVIPLHQITSRQPELGSPSVSTERDPPPVGQDAVTARVDLQCRGAGEISVKDCVVLSETPKGSGFGQMSLKLADRLRVQSHLGRPDPIVVPLAYRGIRAPSADPHIFADAEWARKPDLRDLFYPAAAKSVPGEAMLECVVSSRGKLQNCEVLSETPAGLGFGAAALRSSRIFKFWPATVDGRPIDGAIARIPVHIGPSPQG